MLDVEGAVQRAGTGWTRTREPWRYDTERLEGVAQARRAEQRTMLDYIASDACRMRILRDALDDPGAEDCGRCDNCTGISSDRELDPERVAAALTHLRSAEFEIEPRKQWARGLDIRKGNIKPELRAELGRALAFGSDPGWSALVSATLDAPDGPVPDEVFDGFVAMLKRWRWQQRPTWVCPMPSRTHPLLIASLAERIATIGKMQLVPALSRTWDGHPRQRSMENSTRQAGNVVDTFAVASVLPDGPVLLIDDTSHSGWTLTAAAEALRAAGSGPVLPAVLWRQP